MSIELHHFMLILIINIIKFQKKSREMKKMYYLYKKYLILWHVHVKKVVQIQLIRQ